jgi:hypothetical protein
MFGNPTEIADNVFFNSVQVFLNLFAAGALGLAIAWVYRRTHHGLSYSQSFVVSLVLVAIIGCGAVMVIGSNIARAFGLVGALSIIRYRTVVKDTRDTSFIFLALVAGFACGTSSFVIGVMTVAVVLGIAFVAHHFRFGVLKEHDFIVSFGTKRSEEGTMPAYQAIFDKLCQRHTLLHVEAGEKPGDLLVTFDVSLREGINSPELVDALAKTPDVIAPRLIFAQKDPGV